jgi:hypothetical protein
MPDWIGDQMAGVRPEATRVFGRNAQTPVIHRRLGERFKSTLSAALKDRSYERKRSSADGKGRANGGSFLGCVTSGSNQTAPSLEAVLNRRQADVLDPIKGLREPPAVANGHAPACRRRLAKPPDFRYIPLRPPRTSLRSG